MIGGPNKLSRTSTAPIEPARSSSVAVAMTLLRGSTFVHVVATAPDFAEARRRALEMLAAVKIRDPERVFHCYPHEISGGQAQRVMIAMALAGNPDLLIADEPTTSLDVTIQSQILDLVLDLQADLGTSVVLITHDLGIVAEVCDRVAVMYAGQIVEETDTRTLFRAPLHPYTQGLIGSVPVIGQRRERLEVIPAVASPFICAVWMFLLVVGLRRVRTKAIREPNTPGSCV